MTTPFEELAGLDRLVHEPTRLAILMALSACESADFRYLLTITGLTKGNLSAHLWKLEEAGLVGIEKSFVGKMPNTRAWLTPTGQRAVAGYWKRLERLRDGAAQWQPTPDAEGSG
jgi:DNA-binding MarR family transcriptional regulator